jgi:hypothetical protein
MPVIGDDIFDLSCGPDPATSVFAGMTTAQLRLALVSAQNAYLTLSTGGMRASISYTQGESSKSATFTKGDLGAISQLIRQLQWMLGLAPTARQRPFRFVFR